MKKIVSLIIISFITVSTFAQVNEGKIKFKVELSSSDPAVSSQLSMLSGTAMDIYFTEGFTRSELNMGMFMTTTTIVDQKGGKAITLMSGMMGKKALETPISKGGNGDEVATMRSEKTSETKKIQGYTCTKYILTNEDGEELFFWVTTDIAVSKEGTKFFKGQFEGFPLEFEAQQGPLKLTFVATEVLNSLKKMNKKELFSTVIPSDYTVISEEDLKSLGGGL